MDIEEPDKPDATVVAAYIRHALKRSDEEFWAWVEFDDACNFHEQEPLEGLNE
jgi:hypothetical protein